MTQLDPGLNNFLDCNWGDPPSSKFYGPICQLLTWLNECPRSGSDQNSEAIFGLPSAIRTRWCRRNSDRSYRSRWVYCSQSLLLSFRVIPAKVRRNRLRTLVVLSEGINLAGGTARETNRRVGIDKPTVCLFFADVNRNTEWFTYPGVWATYISILFISWIVLLSLFNCSSGMAWTVLHLAHFLVTYLFFHWKKGTPFADDQGVYNKLTWWEQIENGEQLTRNRKFLTVVPVVLYLIASHTTDYQNPMLFLNTVAVFVLVIAKFPNMHKVRIFGINADH